MTDTLIFGVPIAVLTLGLVEVLKRGGLPTRYAGVAAIVVAALLAALADLAGMAAPAVAEPFPVRLAAWLLAGVVYGLAAAGVYTQGKRLAATPRNEPPPAGM
ncbi:MAG: hypothetical protein U0031_20590 [Thermomicrobiales bacterium]